MTNMPIWRIRAATPDDAETLSLIGAASFLESFAGIVHGQGIVAHCRKAHSAQTYRDYLAAGGRAWLAEVEPGHAPVGYALTCAPELDQAREGDVELKRIYVLSRFQGTVISSALFRNVLDSVRAEGHRRLLLGVKNDNHRALSFYAKNNFETIGSRSFDVGGTIYDDFVLARPLEPVPTA
ncbi:GNAT family N-acetyltransferase [Novosphingobium profundi]|uniref:GNAT family N-acetyltransferase n=1 Tax=Novosphingobium profundi TaxID=1774954 RepID=UPI001BDAD40D|nr:GNAT family N-acetyltransferase [Novosphingobium profundi]MBT0667844.1 GNAT family N-acetyltransferase [Novosphingobium profundi]